MSKVDVVLGTQWGDEGKGKLVDTIGDRYIVLSLADFTAMISVAVLQVGRMPVIPLLSRVSRLLSTLCLLVLFSPMRSVLLVMVVL